MKDITHKMPDWFSRKQTHYLDFLQRHYFVDFIMFSKVAHRAIAICNANPPTFNASTIVRNLVRIDFDRYECVTLCPASTKYDIGGVHVDKLKNNEHDASFVRFELENTYNTIMPYGNDLILDAKFNNAPNLDGTDTFDKDKPSYAHIFGDYLYFEHHGTRYLVDGDYNVKARLPGKIATTNIFYTKYNPTQFILEDGISSKCMLYDIETNEIVIHDIAHISEVYPTNFETESGDIYEYEITKGKFILHSKHDEFIDGMAEMEIDHKYRMQTKDRIDIIHIYEARGMGMRPNLYIVEDNKVINKYCPFVSISFQTPNRLFCISKNGIDDVYMGRGQFAIGAFNLDKKDEKLWFEKE